MHNGQVEKVIRDVVIRVGCSPRIAEAIELLWIDAKEPGRSEQRTLSVLRNELGLTEQEALSLGAELSCVLMYYVCGVVDGRFPNPLKPALASVEPRL